MAISNLVLFIFISIYKPYGRYKSFQHKLTGLFDSCIHKTWSIQAMMALWTIFSTICLPNVWRSQIYWFILSLFLYTSHMGAINHSSTNLLVYLILVSTRRGLYKPWWRYEPFLVQYACQMYGALKFTGLSYLYFYIQAIWAL